MNPRSRNMSVKMSIHLIRGENVGQFRSLGWEWEERGLVGSRVRMRKNGIDNMGFHGLL
jgi:hypothetical protein